MAAPVAISLDNIVAPAVAVHREPQLSVAGERLQRANSPANSPSTNDGGLKILHEQVKHVGVPWEWSEAEPLVEAGSAAVFRIDDNSSPSYLASNGGAAGEGVLQEVSTQSGSVLRPVESEPGQ